MKKQDFLNFPYISWMNEFLTPKWSKESLLVLKERDIKVIKRHACFINHAFFQLSLSVA